MPKQPGSGADATLAVCYYYTIVNDCKSTSYEQCQGVLRCFQWNSKAEVPTALSGHFASFGPTCRSGPRRTTNARRRVLELREPGPNDWPVTRLPLLGRVARRAPRRDGTVLPQAD